MKARDHHGRVVATAIVCAVGGVLLLAVIILAVCVYNEILALQEALRLSVVILPGLALMSACAIIGLNQHGWFQ